MSDARCIPEARVFCDLCIIWGDSASAGALGEAHPQPTAVLLRPFPSAVVHISKLGCKCMVILPRYNPIPGAVSICMCQEGGATACGDEELDVNWTISALLGVYIFL